MAYTASADGYVSVSSPPPRTAAIQRLLMWAIGAGGAIVLIEPSPYELATMAGVVVFYATGMRMKPALIPLLILMFCLNMGYTICSVSLMDRPEIVNWIVTTWYMAITVMFFAIVLSEDTLERLNKLRAGLILGAVVASLAGIAGYLHVVPGGYDLLTLYGRARGTFKDPNVLGAYLILPALFALQSIVTERFGKAFTNTIALGIISIAVFFAFSRASWGQLVVCSAFMLLLMYLTSQTTAQRRRIVIMTVAAIIAVVVILAILLSFESVRNIFTERASFNQTYDSGRFGRFGRHVLGFQIALDLPLGIGPLQFHNFFPEDTHNSFLNAFMSGGWISGICFPALVFMTVIRGFTLIFLRVPWQRAYLALFSAFLGTVAESFIIDVDHWRHFWLMMGAMWGMFVAASEYRRTFEMNGLSFYPSDNR
jgi:hypothetical protein